MVCARVCRCAFDGLRWEIFATYILVCKAITIHRLNLFAFGAYNWSALSKHIICSDDIGTQTQTEMRNTNTTETTLWDFANVLNFHRSQYLLFELPLSNVCVRAGSKYMRPIFRFIWYIFKRIANVSWNNAFGVDFEKMTLNFLAWKMKWHIFATDPNRMTNRFHLANY